MKICSILFLTWFLPVFAFAVPALDAELLKKLITEKDLVQLALRLGGMKTQNGKFIELKGLSYGGIEMTAHFSTSKKLDPRFSLYLLKPSENSDLNALLHFIKEHVNLELGEPVFRKDKAYAEDLPKGVVVPSYVWRSNGDFVILCHHKYSEEGFVSFSKISRDMALMDPFPRVAQWWKEVDEELKRTGGSSTSSEDVNPAHQGGKKTFSE